MKFLCCLVPLQCCHPHTSMLRFFLLALARRAYVQSAVVLRRLLLFPIPEVAPQPADPMASLSFRRLILLISLAAQKRLCGGN